MDLHGKRILVVGLGQTGIAVARFCHARGSQVTVTDSRAAEAMPDRVRQVDPFAKLELGGHKLESFTGADAVVMSPGVPELPEMRAARAAGVEVIAEIELAARFFHPQSTLIAITGTNGKSTTTALIGALCEASGRPTFCGGNLGNYPLIDAVDHPANCAGGLIVAEVAGFMLETCVSFRPKVALCLNISEDHLDRYGTMDVYSAMKTRIFRWQEPGDIAIANAGCRLTMAGVLDSKAEVYTFDSKNPVKRGAYLDASHLILELPSGQERYERDKIPLVGTHNMENAMAAFLAARLAGVSSQDIRHGAPGFEAQPHRMQSLGLVAEVEYFDDSKGTNVAAVAASVKGFPKPVVLIAGGVDKGGSYQELFEALAGAAKGLVLVGEATPIIRKAALAFGVAYPVLDAKSLDEAVRLAAGLASAGDAVILSPACSSYDMFRNFEERGRAFASAVSAMKGSEL